jgi:hypothetical protein
MSVSDIASTPDNPSHLKVGVDGSIVAITWDDREELMDELSTLAGMWPTIEKLRDADPTLLVRLEPHERDGVHAAIRRLDDGGTVRTSELTELLGVLIADRAARDRDQPDAG